MKAPGSSSAMVVSPKRPQFCCLLCPQNLLKTNLLSSEELEMNRKTNQTIAAILIIFVTFTFGSNPALAKKKSDETKIRNHIQRWGDHCKRDIAERYRASQSDVRVSVGATEREAIDAGDITWNDMKRYGLSYNWEIQQRNGSADGYCNIGAEGKDIEIVAKNEDFRNNHSSGSDDDAEIQAYIERWSRECKNAAAENYDTSMSDVRVSVGATERQSIDSGDLTLDDIERYGLSFNWEVRQRNGKADGYCNVSGRGQIVDFTANHEEHGSSHASGSGDDAKIEARVGRWGKNCKNKVAEQFDVPMSDIQVSVGATMQQSIDAGEMTLNEIERYGLSFNWEVNSRYKSANGYCNTDGDGNVVEFRQ